MDRISSINRDTFETKISLTLNIDGKGENKINTGIGFFDHMLTHISKHGFIDLDLDVSGDLYVDCHHTIEDVGIVLGKSILSSVGDKKGIKRYGQAIIPMDETLVICALDLSGRAFLSSDCEFTMERIGDFDTEMVEEFFRAVSSNALMNLHFKVLSFKNNHHLAEAMFKAFGKALDEATSFDSRVEGVISTKGMLD